MKSYKGIDDVTGPEIGGRRAALRHFLRSRRGRLTPDAVGLVAGGRRHTPGLRREEVAVLAGVSASWYTWLEQGRDIKVSDGVLDAISAALKLDDIERAHLYLLAGVNPPPLDQRISPEEVGRLRLVVEGWPHAPAFVVDRYWNTLLSNTRASEVLGVRDRDYNYLWSFFTDATNRRRYPRWHDDARRLVGQFRVQAARFPNDPAFERMTERLCTESQHFERLWARHDTVDSTAVTVELRGDSSSGLRFEHITLGLSQRAEPRLMLFIPRVDDELSITA
ncbi:helix-turn-helix transcriptional regulator [Nocardia sp. NPDC052566]|uniref:helix-turn-helix transcriptional regulator n=1 Tax=Nocardia sp. NPDC052566 TaxID=3364330 RepID=UPI0037C84DC8